MKELTIEEKAKRYGEALERAKKLQKTCDSMAVVGWCEYIFPELKEREEERIKREILELVSIAGNGNQFEEIKDWLEKQGKHKPYGQRKECEDCQFNYAGECKGYCALKRNEHKPTDEVKPKFHEGDYIVPNDITFPETWRVINIDKDNYYNIQCITNPKYDEIYRVPGFVLEKDYHLWSINDAKDGDIVYYECNNTKNLFIVKSVGEIKDHIEGHFWYSITRNECEVWDGRLPYSNIASMCNAMPATKEQRDLLFSKMKEIGYA